MTSKPSMKEILATAKHMQEQMTQAQTKLSEMVVDVTAGPDGGIKLTGNGHYAIESITIAPDILQAAQHDQGEALADHLKEAFNKLVAVVTQASDDQLKAISDTLPWESS